MNDERIKNPVDELLARIREIRVSEKRKSSGRFFVKNMNLQANYLTRDEIDTLNRLVIIAERRYNQSGVKRRAAEAIEADCEDIAALEETQEKLLKKPEAAE